MTPASILTYVLGFFLALGIAVWGCIWVVRACDVPDFTGGEHE